MLRGGYGGSARSGEVLTGETLNNVEFTDVRGTEGIKEAPGMMMAGMEVRWQWRRVLMPAQAAEKGEKQAKPITISSESWGCPWRL